MTLGKNLENGTTQTEYAYNVAGGLASTAFYVAGKAVEALTGNFFERRVGMPNSGYCSLIIKGDDLDLDLIADTLKITASEKRKKGEIINSVIGEIQYDFIRFDEKMSGKYNPDKTLIALLNKLMDYEVFLKNLSVSACVYIKCYVQSDYAQIGYMLSAMTLSKIAQLGIDLELSILSWGGVKKSKTKKKKKGK